MTEQEKMAAEKMKFREDFQKLLNSLEGHSVEQKMKALSTFINAQHTAMVQSWVDKTAVFSTQEKINFLFMIVAGHEINARMQDAAFASVGQDRDTVNARLDKLELAAFGAQR